MGPSQVRLLSGLCLSLGRFSGPAGRMLLHSLPRRHRGKETAAERSLGISTWTAPPPPPPPAPLRAEADSQASVEHLCAGPSSVQGGGWAFGLEPWICLLAGASGTMGPGFRAHLGDVPRDSSDCQGPPFFPAVR